MKSAATDESLSNRDRRIALEKLERWGEQGSKFAQAALAELGVGTRTMSEKQFKSTINKLGLDDKTKRKLTALGPKFMSYVGNLTSEDTPDARMQLKGISLTESEAKGRKS